LRCQITDLGLVLVQHQDPADRQRHRQKTAMELSRSGRIERLGAACAPSIARRDLERARCRAPQRRRGVADMHSVPWGYTLPRNSAARTLLLSSTVTGHAMNRFRRQRGMPYHPVRQPGPGTVVGRATLRSRCRNAYSGMPSFRATACCRRRPGAPPRSRRCRHSASEKRASGGTSL
jgi:hypothetical protein